mmetsp:Transcript_30624/g.55437  ORF Transcript_30624/g.55437 Transcript_30624/m.55437 type:complete len:101 (-) Transcript_30624:111-413(-)
MMRLSRNHPDTFLHHITRLYHNRKSGNSIQQGRLSLNPNYQDYTFYVDAMEHFVRKKFFPEFAAAYMSIEHPVMLCVPIFSDTLYCTNLEVFTCILMAGV